MTDVGRAFVSRLHLGFAFTRAALIYWFQVFPFLASEMYSLHRRARTIPDASLRTAALGVQHTKRGNLEGSAAFAAFAPRSSRKDVIRAQVALQSIYDYVDTLAEQQNRNPIGNSYQLHQALRRALEPTLPHTDYYLYQATHRDGCYLMNIVEMCRAGLVNLPSQQIIAEPTGRLVERIICYQSFNMPPGLIRGDPLKAWAANETPIGGDLRWWETAASAGSSLGIFALLAFAADPALTSAEAVAIEQTYFPWIGALHSLLDNLIDMKEDATDGQRNFMTLYASPQEAAARLRTLTARSIEHIETLSNSEPHRLVLAGLVGFYLSAPEADSPDVRQATRHVLGASDAITRIALQVHRVRRLVG